MTQRIDEQLAQLPQETLKLLEEHGFDRDRFAHFAEKLKRGEPFENAVQAAVRPPEPGDIVEMPADGSDERKRMMELGTEALREGSVALVVLAGGMATRMGGVVKALVEALPGKSFLDLRLAQQQSQRELYGKTIPLWLMTSNATHDATVEALGELHDGYNVATFRQYLSLRLTETGDVFFDDEGKPSVHAPGHGDLPEALQESGLLKRFVEQGGRTLMLTNLDNLGGTIEADLLGFHLSHPATVTSEVVDKLASDRGGIPVRMDEKAAVLEEFRLPKDFDPNQVSVFNTNVFYVDAQALLELDREWTYAKVEKKVGDRKAIQFERILNEITHTLSARYLHLPRTGAGARFLPCKDHSELAARRDEIELVARTRGMIPS